MGLWEAFSGEGGNSTPLQQLIFVSWNWLLFLFFFCRWCLPMSGVLKPPALSLNTLPFCNLVGRNAIRKGEARAPFAFSAK